jgi:hypothetical protein
MHPPNGIASIACSASRPEPTAASLPSLCGFVDFSFKSTVTLRRPLRSDTHRPRLRTGLSRQANPSLSVGTKSAGNAFARARDRAAFCTRKPPSPAAETGNASPASAKVAEHRGLFKRPQEIVFVQDCVVDDAVLIGPVSVLNSLLTGNLTGNFSNLGLFLRFSLLIGEQIQSLADKFPTQWNREFFD